MNGVRPPHSDYRFVIYASVPGKGGKLSQKRGVNVPNFRGKLSSKLKKRGQMSRGEMYGRRFYNLEANKAQRHAYKFFTYYSVTSTCWCQMLKLGWVLRGNKMGTGILKKKKRGGNRYTIVAFMIKLTGRVFFSNFEKKFNVWSFRTWFATQNTAWPSTCCILVYRLYISCLRWFCRVKSEAWNR
jgi:hypothetical protein